MKVFINVVSESETSKASVKKHNVFFFNDIYEIISVSLHVLPEICRLNYYE